MGTKQGMTHPCWTPPHTRCGIAGHCRTTAAPPQTGTTPTARPRVEKETLQQMVIIFSPKILQVEESEIQAKAMAENQIIIIIIAIVIPRSPRPGGSAAARATVLAGRGLREERERGGGGGGSDGGWSGGGEWWWWEWWWEW